MIIRDFNIKRVAAFPFETNPPLVVDSDTVLSFSVALQFFEAIRRRDSQVVNVDRIIDHPQFAQRHLLNVGWQFARSLASIDLLCFGISEGFDHRCIIWCDALSVKR